MLYWQLDITQKLPRGYTWHLSFVILREFIYWKDSYSDKRALICSTVEVPVTPICCIVIDEIQLPRSTASGRVRPRVRPSIMPAFVAEQ